MEITADGILKIHNLKCTACRKHIINDLLNDEVALSEQEMNAKSSDLFDRVTMYRTLKTLEECNIIHSIILSDNTVKYALSKKSMLESTHAHFHCISCDDVVCMDNIVDQNVQLHLPQGYAVLSSKLLLEGTCPHCK